MADVADRKAWMGLLARAPADRLAALMPREVPDHAMLRAPEVGAVMVRGRAGATGAAFNLGEMTVTRCAVQVQGGLVGHAYVAGRDTQQAELAALLDALLQDPARQPVLLEAVIEPLAAVQAEAASLEARRAAATKVEFLTMVTSR